MLEVAHGKVEFIQAWQKTIFAELQDIKSNPVAAPSALAQRYQLIHPPSKKAKLVAPDRISSFECRRANC